MAEKNVLEIKNFSVSFLSNDIYIPAIRNISLQIKEGEILAIVGESGSGKSVTALSILQLLPPMPAKKQSGEIIFFTKNQSITLNDSSFKVLENIRGNKIGIVFQEPMSSLNPVLTCGAQLVEAMKAHQKWSDDKAGEEVIHLLNELALPHPELLFKKYPHQLSGGQQQRVMIAMAICCKPALLVCDEPTTALDTIVQKNILELIQSVRKKFGMAVLFISHDLGVVAEIADRIVVMYKGEIVETGSRDTILKSPTHPYTKSLLYCRPSLYAKGDKLPVIDDFLNNPNYEKKVVELFKKDRDSINHIEKKITPVLVSLQSVNVIFQGEKRFLGAHAPSVHAVKDVSFDIFEGETLGLVGESGCGKTTLGRALAKLQPITEGKIFFRGKDLSQLSAKEMRKQRTMIQVIFQDPYSSLNPRIRVGDAIAEPLKVHYASLKRKEIKNRVVELLIKTGLKEQFYYRYPHECSGGQRQRIVIARALALNPTFVICDESVSALDMNVQAQILNLLNELKELFQFTALFISHDLSVIRYISDRILVMDKGRIIEKGLTKDIYENPQTEYTKRLLEAIPGKEYFIPGNQNIE
ncbi:MAG: ABC transporter ATP-binding protein [Bacteroidetes bacterium]|nr:ABC transporter ATP-binding protein [Bacteroidota bacterium]